MGLKGHEVRKTTLKEFGLMLNGYIARQHREWDRTRHIMSYIATFAGLGAKEFVTPQSVYPLPTDGEETKKMKITTSAQAEKLLKEFE